MDERPGSWKVATVKGVPVFVHWSLPAAGLLVSAIAGFNLAEAAFYFAGTSYRSGAASYFLVRASSYCAALGALVAIHESGHLAAARLLGLQVFAVDISGLGGQCRIQAPRNVRDILVVYSAGLLAQGAVFLVALVLIEVFGPPRTLVARSFANTFIYFNIVMFVLNIIPGRTPGGLSNDGYILWKAFLHVVGGRPHPFPNPLATSRVFSPDTRLLSVKGLKPSGFVTGIEILNDNTTPMEFVVTTLVQHLRLTRQDAIDLMVGIHSNGGVLVPIAGSERAEAVATSITSDARHHGHALVCRAVNADAP